MKMLSFNPAGPLRGVAAGGKLLPRRSKGLMAFNAAKLAPRPYPALAAAAVAAAGGVGIKSVFS